MFLCTGHGHFQTLFVTQGLEAAKSLTRASGQSSGARERRQRPQQFEAHGHCRVAVGGHTATGPRTAGERAGGRAGGRACARACVQQAGLRQCSLCVCVFRECSPA